MKRTTKSLPVCIVVAALMTAVVASAETSAGTQATVTFDTVTYGTSRVEIPAWKEPAGQEKVGIMASSRMGRLFMDEFLPPFFERTLVLEEPVKKGEEIKWVFTNKCQD